MNLFDDMPRAGDGPIRSDESDFEYLNRSARQEIAAVAGLLETWFSRCPPECQADIRGRLRDKNSPQFHSAFFELFLMELLRTLGCTFEVHPNMPGVTAHPDFLVRPPDGESFYLEAATVNPAADRVREAAFKSQVLEQLDQIQDSPFHFIVRDSGDLLVQPRSRHIRDRTEAWLRSLDRAVVEEADQGQRGRSDVELVHTVGDWSLTITALPSREKGRRVGFVGAVESIADHERIRSTIETKGPKYGKPDRSYVVALNLGPIMFCNDYDVHTAIFGFEQVTVSRSANGDLLSSPPRRAGGGAFFDRNEPRRTRVSALLVAKGLRPGSLRTARLKLMHNPWGAIAHQSCLTMFPQEIADGDEYREIEGVGLCDVLKLPVSYPDW